MENDVFLSADQTRQLLHISKCKCVWLLQNGIIPCTVSGKKTHCYRVRLEDVQEFASRSAEYVTPVTFTANRESAARQFQTPPEEFRPWLDDYWYDIDNILSPPEVERATGYSQTAVSRWISGGELRSVTAHGSILIVRDWLIDFMCGYGWRIIRKSEKHKEIIKKYYSKA